MYPDRPLTLCQRLGTSRLYVSLRRTAAAAALAAMGIAGCGPSSGPPADRATDPVGVLADPRPDIPADLAPRFRHLTIEDGLSQNAANALLQDRRRFLWIGTQDGLNRYDGSGFVVYRHNPFDPTTLSSSYVTALHEDADGYLWVGTLGGGLNRLDPDTGVIVRYANVRREHVEALATDGHGALWVGTNGQGVLRMALADGHRPDAPVERFDSAHGPADRLVGDQVGALFVDGDDDVWVATSKALNRFDRARGGFVRYAAGPDSREAPPDSVVTALVEDAGGTLWLGTPLGLSRVDGDSGRRFAQTRFPMPASVGGWSVVREIVAGPDGALWFTSGLGLTRFDPRTGTYTPFHSDAADPEGLAGELVNSLLWDRAGVLWVGTNGYGLDRYDTKRTHFQTLRRPPALASPASGFSVRSLLEAADGTLWISARVLYRYDPRTGTLALADVAAMGLPVLAGEEVTSMIQDRQGGLWFASLGLHRYDPRTGEARSYTYDAGRPEGMTRRHAFGVFEDRRGAVWALTPHHISRLADPEAGRFVHYRHTPEALASSITPSVHEDGRGRFWIATEAGLVRFDPRTGAVRRYRTDPSDPASLSEDLVRSVLPDPAEPDRVLWVGTAGGGLNRFDVEAETFTHVTTREGLPNNVVYAALPDAEGRLWLSTNRGLARYDAGSGEVRSFDARDGLQSDEFNSGAYHRGASGRLYFGGIYGVNAFDPEAIADNAVVPPVVLTGLRIGDRPVAAGDSTGLLDRALWATDVLRLSHRENMVTFTFAALDFSAPEKNRYAYRMEGFDDGWIQAGTDRTATYTNLPPGRYTFRVRGSNNDGVWNEEGAALAVTVAPPWWRAWWAYGLYALGAFGVVVALVRVRDERQRLAQRAEAERVEADALRDLDAAKSAFFANVSHEFRTPLTLTLGPLDDLGAGLHGPLAEPQAQQVDLARRNAGRVLDLINQILDVARLESGRTPLRARPLDLGAFVESVAAPFATQAGRQGLAFEVVAPTAPVEVYADPAQLETALGNLLSNAVKFTPRGGTVRVSAEADGGEARVAVRDSGPGIPASDLPHVFDRFYQVGEGAGTRLGTGIGLALANEIAGLHGGALAVESEEGFGSLFTLTLPLGRAHLAPEQVVETPEPWAGPASEDLAEPGGDGLAGAEAPVEPDDGTDRTTVLVVEDHADVRAYVRRHLDPAYRVLEAADGEAGLAMARERLPDLVVSDVMMPKLDGLGLCRALKADPETDFIPVVLLTAKAATEDRLDGLREHCDDYLTKPFDPAELRARIGNLIAVRQRLRERFRQPGGASVPADASPASRDIPSADAVFVADVRAAVEDHLGDPDFGTEALAEAVGQSRTTLYRRLKAATGQTPSELLRVARLERAAALLAARAGTVGEVAYAVGYKSVAHFSNGFLEHHGCRPSAYAVADAE